MRFSKLEFCKTLDVKKRQAIEHELRRLRREGDENIAMHARTSVTVKVSFILAFIFTLSDNFQPSNTQLRICFVHNAVPFIGFGFLDNFVMLIAGDYFEATLGLISSPKRVLLIHPYRRVLSHIRTCCRRPWQYHLRRCRNLLR